MARHRNGIEPCRDYQVGKCPDTGNNGRCGVNPSLAHQCAKCLLQGHGANACTRDAAKPIAKGKGKGKRAKGGGGKYQY